jgi:type I site-specific restriction-modification system R (restriction) subunit
MVANREIYKLLVDGVKVRVSAVSEEEADKDRTVRVIDWTYPNANHFFVAPKAPGSRARFARSGPT